MNKNVFYFLFLVFSFVSIGHSQERRLVGLMRAPVRAEEQPQFNSYQDAWTAQMQKEKQNGRICCMASIVPALVSAGAWAWIAYNDTSNGLCMPPIQESCYQNSQIAALDCCCKVCALTSWTMCAVGTCAVCECDDDSPCGIK